MWIGVLKMMVVRWEGEIKAVCVDEDEDEDDDDCYAQSSVNGLVLSL